MTALPDCPGLLPDLPASPPYDVVARADFPGDGEELPLRVGDRLRVEGDRGGWLYGTKAGGEKGWFPKSYAALASSDGERRAEKAETATSGRSESSSTSSEDEARGRERDKIDEGARKRGGEKRRAESESESGSESDAKRKRKHKEKKKRKHRHKEKKSKKDKKHKKKAESESESESESDAKKKSRKDKRHKKKKSKKQKRDRDSSDSGSESDKEDAPVRLSDWRDGDQDAPRSMITGEVIKRDRKQSKEDIKMEKKREKKLAAMNGQYLEIEKKDAKQLRKETLESNSQAQLLLDNIQSLSSSAYRGFDPEREAVLQEASTMKNYCQYLGLSDGRIICFKKGIGRDTENLTGKFQGWDSGWAKKSSEGFTKTGWAQLTMVGAADGTQESKASLSTAAVSTKGKKLKRSLNPHGQIMLPERSNF